MQLNETQKNAIRIEIDKNLDLLRQIRQRADEAVRTYSQQADRLIQQIEALESIAGIEHEETEGGDAEGE